MKFAQSDIALRKLSTLLDRTLRIYPISHSRLSSGCCLRGHCGFPKTDGLPLWPRLVGMWLDRSQSTAAPGGSGARRPNRGAMSHLNRDTVPGVIMSFCDHIDYVYKKAQQRLFLLRKLNSFGVSQHILRLVYRGLIASVLSINIIMRYANVCAKNKIKLAHVVNTASKVIDNEQKHLSSIYNAALKRKARQIPIL